MDIQEALYNHLTTDPTVAGLVVARIYPLVIPQDIDLPAIAYQRITGPRFTAHDGATGLAKALIQITSQGSTYSDAKALAAAIRECTVGFKGIMGGQGGIYVDGAFIRSELDGYSQPAESQTVRLDIEFIYRE